MPYDSKAFIVSIKSSKTEGDAFNISERVSISNIFPITEAYFNIIISLHFNESIIFPITFSIIKGIFNFE